jgi:hypothetical protein
MNLSAAEACAEGTFSAIYATFRECHILFSAAFRQDKILPD